MTDLFNSSKWNSSPTAYWTIQYEYQRSGANMQYRFYWKVWLGYSSSYYNNGLQLQLFLDGVQNDVTVKGSGSGSGWSYEGTTGWYTVSNKTSGTTSFVAKLKDTNTSAIKVTSSTYSLTVAPAYATSVQSLNSKTETTIKMNWSSNNTIDYIWYSKDDGSSWVGVDVTDGTSGSYTISGLENDTTYKIKTRVRRKDSQLTTDSSTLSVTTYDYPYCINAPDFTIGDKLTLTFYNPLGRTIEITVIGANGKEDGVNVRSGTTCEPYNSAFYQDFWYSTLPNAQQGTYRVKVACGDITSFVDGGTYKIKGTEVPTVSTLEYKDMNKTVTDITGNDQHIVQNQSSLSVIFGEATAINHAKISKYTFELNGVTKESKSAGGTVDFGAVNSSRDLTLTMTVTDSRGLTAKTTLEVTMLAHSNPSAVVTLERLNNYEDETYLTVNGSVSSVNGKNTMDIKYRYKVSGGSYPHSLEPIADNTKQTLSLSKSNSYIFNVVVTDAFGSKYSKEYVLNKGVFPLFIDTVKNAVGINEFPADDEALRVADGIAHFEDGVRIGGQNLDYVIEHGTSGIWRYRKWNSGYVELYGKKANATYSVSNATGSIYYASAGGWTFPFTLTALYSASVTMLPSSSNCWVWFGKADRLDGIDDTYIGRATSLDVTGQVCCHITGTWK